MWEQTRNHIETTNLDRTKTWFTGDAIWSMFDYCGYERKPTSLCGISDVFRLPKISYYFHQSQRDPSIIIPGVNSGPMVYIAKYWTGRYSYLPVRVFSNCDSVYLYLNGTLVAKQAPDKGPLTGIAGPVLLTSLLHPPFTFSTVSYQAGTLKAEGRTGGVVKATHEIRTPEAASRISVRIDTAGLPLQADGSDIAFVYASVVDQNGTLITTAKNSIQFSVPASAGTIIGPNPQPADAGIAVVLLQTKTTPGPITVTASSTGLASGSSTSGSVAVVQPVFQPKIQLSPTKREFLNFKSGNRLSFVIPGPIQSRCSAGFKIFNAQGAMVRSYGFDRSGPVTLDIRSLAAGMYCGQLVINDQAAGTEKILVNGR